MEQWEADQNGNQLNHYNMIFRPLLLTVAYRFSGHVHVEVGAVQGIAGGDLLQEGGVLLQVGPCINGWSRAYTSGRALKAK